MVPNKENWSCTGAVNNEVLEEMTQADDEGHDYDDEGKGDDERIKGNKVQGKDKPT